MITVKDEVTIRTMVSTIRKWHDLAITTTRAILGCVSGVDFDELSTSPFCLVREVMSKVRPRRIHNTFSESVILNHSIDGQIFYSNEAKLIGRSRLEAPRGITTRYFQAKRE